MRSALRTLVVLALAVGLLAVFLYHVDLRRVGSEIVHAQPEWLMLSFITTLENLVIREDGFRKLLNAFNTQRCLNPSISLGLAEGAFEEARKYVRDRTVFGKAVSRATNT